MIEIIQHAHGKPTRKISECKNCGCVFIFDKSDIKQMISNQYDGFPYDDILFLSWKCPECHKFVFIEAGFVGDFQDYCDETNI